MRKFSFKKTALVLAGLFSGMFISCDMLPHKVSIKTDAELKVPLGTAYLNLKEYINSNLLVEKIRGAVGNSAEVYDIQKTAGDDVLSYMVHFPIYSCPFDPGAYFSSIDLDGIIGSSPMSDIEQSFTIPAINVENEITKSLEELIGTSLMDSMELSVADIQLTDIYEGLVGETNASTNIDFEVQYANAIKYLPGSKITMNVEKKDSTVPGSGFSMKCRIKIAPQTVGSYTYEGYEGPFVDITKGGVLEIPLDKGYLTKKLTLTVEYKYSGGTPGNEHDYLVKFASIPTDKVEKICEIDLTGGTSDTSDDIAIPSLSLDEMKINVGSLPGMFIQATIGAGDISLSAPMPEGWENISLNLEDFELSGMGLSLDENDFADLGGAYLLNTKANLAGQKIKKFEGIDVTVNGTIAVECQGATIDLVKGKEIKTTTNMSVTELSSVDVDVKNLSFALDDEGLIVDGAVAEYISEITFQEDPAVAGAPGMKKAASGYVPGNGFGIKCNAVNTLPAGNVIPVKISSDFFGLNGSKAISASINGTGNTDSTELKLNSFEKITLANGGLIDFKIDFGTEKVIDGFNYTNCLSLTNIVAGKEYKLGLTDAEFLCDWNKVVVALGDDTSIVGEMDLSQFSVSELLSQLPIPVDQFEIGEMNAYFFAQRPKEESMLGVLLSEVSLTGTMGVSYKDKNDVSQTIDLLENCETAANGNKIVPFVSLVEWPSKELDKLTPENASEFLSYLSKEKTSFYCDIAKIINDTPSELDMNYSLKLANSYGADVQIPLWSYQLEDSEEDDVSAVTIDMVCEIPLKLRIKDQMTFDILEMASSINSAEGDSGESGEGGEGGEEPETERDLLGRESASTWEEFADYADSIEFFKLTYTIDNKVVNGLEGGIRIKDAASGLDVSASFETGKQEFKLTGEQIKSVMTTYPFNPQVLLCLGEEGEDTEITVSRKGIDTEEALSVNIIASIKIDGDKPITLFDADSLFGGE